MDSKGLYDAFKSKDSRFDGKFFVGVTSTGIYCRPVCRARMPKEENCVFFRSAAEAEKAGFRPCLTCRPELAPGFSATDARTALAKKAAKYIEENCGGCGSLEELAARLGYTGRHLRRVFSEEYHVSPVEYMQTCRLLLAKSLLTDTGLSITEIAMASGFGSLRRFNDLFRKQYRISPSGFRRETKTSRYKGGAFAVAVGYRPPYEWDRILDFLSARAIPGVESVREGKYSRTVCMKDKDGKDIFGWISVSDVPEKNVFSVTMSEKLLPVLPKVLGSVRKLFDLYCDPYAVYEKLTDGDGKGPGDFACGIRVPGCFDPFELCVRTILGQQISVKAAGNLAGKLAKEFGTPVDSGFEELSYAFPSAKTILGFDGRVEDLLCPLGIISARARAIQALARVVEENTIDFEFSGEPEAEIKKLRSFPGIGEWTAEYIAMRALGYTDAFPASDLGIRKALGGKKPKEILALSEEWRPWRSYAAMALWDSLKTEVKK